MDEATARPEARQIPAVAVLLAGSVLFSRLLGYVREMVLAYPAADYREGAVPAVYVPAVIDRLHEIAAPALVLVGEMDIPDFHLVADILAENLPHARKLVLPDCGHVSPLEQPNAFNEALTAFGKLQRRYPHLLGGYLPNIQKVDLGSRGIWYRVRIGPLGQRTAAVGFCDELKAAGADCLIRRD